MREAEVRHVFKRCTMCGEEWPTRDEFLSDGRIHLNGFQKIQAKVRTARTVAGLLVFTHIKSGCGTTLCIPAQRFWIHALSPAVREPLEQATIECFAST